MTDTEIRAVIDKQARAYVADNTINAESEDVARILLAAMCVGSRVPRIAKLLGVSRDIVQQIAERMRASGIWTPDSKVSVEEIGKEDSDMGGIEFLLHMNVAEGFIERVEKETEPEADRAE